MRRGTSPSAGKLRDLFRRQRIDGYMFDVEILALAARLDYRIQEVSVRWRDDGDSRLELFRGNVRNVRDIFSIRFSLAELAGADLGPDARAVRQTEKTKVA